MHTRREGRWLCRVFPTYIPAKACTGLDRGVTKITIYICNPHDVPKARGILRTYFADHPPGSTLCVLRGLANPNFLLEIEAIAVV
jgi:enamine deaminase RidA (YjgF/YER057c/UK114 family)